MNGVIVLDKPQGFTSFDAVAVMRGLAKEKKIGHTGTLDPMATGVLPLLLGRAARGAALLPDTRKVYRAGFRLGELRDTGDITGAVTGTDQTPVTRQQLEEALAPFLGDIMQVPPMYSAVSVGGKRLYQLARQGVQVHREPRPVTVFSLAVTHYDPATREGELEAACSQGTYIRVLIEDIARQAGTLGTMTALRRTQACGFTLAQAHPLEELRALAAEGRLAEALLPADSPFSVCPAVAVSGAQAARFLNGGSLDIQRLHLPQGPAGEGALFRVYGPGRRFLGLAHLEPSKGQLTFSRLLAEEG